MRARAQKLPTTVTGRSWVRRPPTDSAKIVRLAAQAGSTAVSTSLYAALDTITEAPSPARSTMTTFRALARLWRDQTAGWSSVDDVVAHPAYRSIVLLGMPVVPLILAELKTAPVFWFQALFEITGEDPVIDDARGDVDAMAAAWIDWGRHHGLTA